MFIITWTKKIKIWKILDFVPYQNETNVYRIYDISDYPKCVFYPKIDFQEPNVLMLSMLR